MGVGAEIRVILGGLCLVHIVINMIIHKLNFVCTQWMSRTASVSVPHICLILMRKMKQWLFWGCHMFSQTQLNMCIGGHTLSCYEILRTLVRPEPWWLLWDLLYEKKQVKTYIENVFNTKYLWTYTKIIKHQFLWINVFCSRSFHARLIAYTKIIVIM